MKRKWLSALIVGSLGAMCALTVIGQTEKTPTLGQYIISAKAGGVNYVEGKVTVIRRSGTSGVVVEGDEIQIGDRVTTGDDGMAEVLLNPGSYLRIGHNTSFEFGSTDLENLKVNLRAGSAVLELFATDDFRVSIKLPQSEMQLTRSGVFRIDVMSDGSARLMVIKGKAYVGPAGSTEVPSGRMAAVTKAGVSISKFDKGATDSLDIWSKSRSKELASLNGHLQRNSLTNSLLSSFNNRGWNIYNSFGLWLFDQRARWWLFLPFGYGWSSPYGWDYDWGLWRCRMPWYVWNPTYYPPAPTSTGGGSNPTTSQEDRFRRQPKPTPPFERAEQKTRVESNNVGIRNSFPSETRGGGESRSSGETRTSFPPVSAPPIIAPAPPPMDTTRSGSKGKPDH
jgi:FecR-like protein